MHVDELMRLEPVGEGGQEDQLLAGEAPVRAVSDDDRHSSEQDEETSVCVCQPMTRVEMRRRMLVEMCWREQPVALPRLFIRTHFSTFSSAMIA